MLVLLPVCEVLGFGWPRHVGDVSGFGFVMSRGLANGSRRWRGQGQRGLGLGSVSAWHESSALTALRLVKYFHSGY